MKETKELLKFIFSLNDAFWKAFEDGSFSLSDLVHFYEVLKSIGAAFEGVELIMSEIKAMTPEDKEKLKTYIEVEFDLPNDQIENAIESALKLALDILEFFLVAKRK